MAPIGRCAVHCYRKRLTVGADPTDLNSCGPSVFDRVGDSLLGDVVKLRGKLHVLKAHWLLIRKSAGDAVELAFPLT